MPPATSHAATPGLKLVVLVSGRGSNLQALLDAAGAKTIKSRVAAVISNDPDAPALRRAREAGVTAESVPSRGKDAAVFHDELLAAIRRHEPDLVVLAGFMKILPEKIINAFADRIVNIHPSLLPAFPGLNAQRQALEAGVKVTGCTVHFVDKGCDTGPIILQDTEPVSDDDTPDSLSARLLRKEHDALVRAISWIEDGRVVIRNGKTSLRKPDRHS